MSAGAAGAGAGLGSRLPRRVRGLTHVEPLASRPKFIPRVRALTGTKGRGLTYERKVGRVLKGYWPHVRSGVWFAFVDRNGPGVCQVDHFVVLPDQVLLVECKLSENDMAWAQINDLYRPILGDYFGLTVTGVQATKHVRSADALLDIRSAVAHPGATALWHCLG